MRTVELLNEAIVAAGGPDNLCAGVVDPTLESARALVTHVGVDMLVITGGAALIRDAFGTGKRVIAAAPACRSRCSTRPPTGASAREIFAGAVYENTILCIGEKSVVAADGVHDRLLAAFADLPAQVLSEERDGFGLWRHDQRERRPRARREFVRRDAEARWRRRACDRAEPVRLLVAPVDAITRAVLDGAVLPAAAGGADEEDSRRGSRPRHPAEGGNRHTAMIYSEAPRRTWSASRARCRRA